MGEEACGDEAGGSQKEEWLANRSDIIYCRFLFRSVPGYDDCLVLRLLHLCSDNNHMATIYALYLGYVCFQRTDDAYI